MTRAAVIGAGPGALAAVANLAHHGVDEIALYNRSEDRLAPIRARGLLEVEALDGEREVRFADLTTDASRAVKGASVVIIATPAYGQVPSAKAVLPHLERGATVVLFSGSCGSLELARLFAEAGRDLKKDILLGETMSLPQSGRMLAPARVRIRLSGKIRTAAFPSSRTDELLERLKGMYDFFRSPNVIDTGINNVNFLIHPAPMLLNYAAVERADGVLSIMNEGMTPAVLRTMDAVDAEKMAIARAFGLTPISVDDLYREIGSSPSVYRTPGEPFNLKDRIWPRYVLEDVPYGTVLLSSLGRLAGVPTPINDGIAHVLSVAEQHDFWAEGRNAERLGLAGMTVPQILRYVETAERR